MSIFVNLLGNLLIYGEHKKHVLYILFENTDI